MAARESAVHKNHNPILKKLNYLPLTFLFIMVAYPGRIFESTEGIEIKLGTYIDVNERKTWTIILSYILLELSFFKFCFYYTNTYIIKEGVYWSQQTVRRLVCWWNIVSPTPPTVFKSSKWNLLHMISMT